MIAGIQRIGGNQIGDIAYDEQFARRRPENHARIDATVRAGDHHRARLLAARQALEPFALNRPSLGPEPPVAIDQSIHDLLPCRAACVLRRRVSIPDCPSVGRFLAAVPRLTFDIFDRSRRRCDASCADSRQCRKGRNGQMCQS